MIYSSYVRNFKLFISKIPIKIKYFLLSLLLISLILFTYNFLFVSEEYDSDLEQDTNWPSKIYRSGGFVVSPSIVTLVFVACKDRIEEALNMVKSAIIFGGNAKRINLIGFGDSANFHDLAIELENIRQLSKKIGVQIEYEVYPSWFPRENHAKWSLMFRPCTTLRLFLPHLLPHIDHVVYIDSDTVFMSDIRIIWQFLQEFDTKQLVAITPEHELPGDGYYNLKAKIPYYKERGLNAGIIPMRLSRMREINIEKAFTQIYDQYMEKIVYADQDILNIYLYFNPERQRDMSCSFNYRIQHCECDYGTGGSCACTDAEENGIHIYHGSRMHFHKEHELSQNIYKAFRAYDLEVNTPKDLLKKLKGDQEYLKNVKNDTKHCSQLSPKIFSKVEEYVLSLNHDLKF